jgi:regulator of sirC expression with transglutaminase-like and TPR domain
MGQDGARLEELAAPIRARGAPEMPAPLQAELMAERLFLEEGFSGNTRDYYDPKNSFFDEVLTRRTGIPVTLSVLYVEVARRAGIHASPVGFPAHFLVRIDDHDRRLVVDPFHGGGVLEEVALAELLRRSGSKLRYSSDMIAPTPTRHVVARMLMDLRGIYAARGEYSRLMVVLDRLIDLLPDSDEEVRDRGFLLGRLGAPDAAVVDLKHYVERMPHAGDVAEVRRWIERFEGRARIEGAN